MDAETVTNQYDAGGDHIHGVLTLSRGETKTTKAVPSAGGRRTYTFQNDGVSVVVGADTYQQGYETPALIFSLE